jgi:hypothetical protein
MSGSSIDKSEDDKCIWYVKRFKPDQKAIDSIGPMTYSQALMIFDEREASGEIVYIITTTPA